MNEVTQLWLHAHSSTSFGLMVVAYLQIVYLLIRRKCLRTLKHGQ